MVRRLVGPTRRRIANTAGKTLAAMQAIVAGFNAIGESLSLAPNRHAPIFEKMDDGTVLATPWCMGFLAAMQLRWKDWTALRDIRQIARGLLLPILLHCTDAHGNPMLGLSRDRPETGTLLREAYHEIPPMVVAIRGFWMPRRVVESKCPD
jgi:uncharacterized protein